MIRTSWLSIGPGSEFYVGFVPFSRIRSEVSLQGTPDNAGSDVRVVDIAGMKENGEIRENVLLICIDTCYVIDF